MAKLKPTEIADVVFREGRWAGLYPEDPSLRRGIQILTQQLHFPSEKLRIHYQVIQHEGLLILSKAQSDPDKPGQMMADTSKTPPVEFNIEGPNGFVCTATDSFDKKIVENKINGAEFRKSLKQAYTKALQAAPVAMYDDLGITPESP